MVTEEIKIMSATKGVWKMTVTQAFLVWAALIVFGRFVAMPISAVWEAFVDAYKDRHPKRLRIDFCSAPKEGNLDFVAVKSENQPKAIIRGSYLQQAIGNLPDCWRDEVRGLKHSLGLA